MAEEPDNLVLQLLMRRLRWALAILPLLLAGGALAHGDTQGFAAGAPGDPKQPARTIDVAMTEDGSGMHFTPDRVEVRAGEQVRFVLHNKGRLAHEFVLGSRAENREHAAMMAEMPDMKHSDANAATVGPGQTSSLLWRFSHKGDLEFACLIPGHYEAGMRGVVVVK